jgi:hypothetical protein
MKSRTLSPRAFGLKTPAPLWTAPAFDRCLLLALIYPIATIFLIWAIFGHVGPAEAALHLQPDIAFWRRGLVALGLGLSTFGILRGVRTLGLKSQILLIVAAGAGLFAFVPPFDLDARGLDVAVGTALGIGVFWGFITAGVGARDWPGIGASLFAIALAIVATVGISGADAVVAIAVSAGVLFVAGFTAGTSKSAIRYRRQGIFFSLFFPAMILACLGFAAVLSPLKTWNDVGPLLLFLGLLTLLNAPFDWASLGLTRALLRRGLELGGWWPYFLALVDAALAGIIIAALALVMVIGVQAFDELAVHGGGKPVLPLDTLFDGIAKNPAAPEYWWAYALLLSSMIPSLINLAIGGMAFTRGIPWLARLILNWIPEGKAVPEYKRQPAAIGLTVQMFAGAGLGIAARGLLAWGLIFHVMPWIGLDLLDMARAVATFDLPMRVARLVAGTL